MEVYLKAEIHFPITKYPYGFSDHLFFFLLFPNSSQYEATSLVINRYRTPRLTNISAAIF